MEDYVKRVMGKEWDTLDLIYLYEFLFDDFIRIEKKKNGEIQSILKGEGEMRMFNDFNENEGDYYLNPVESQFNRLNIQLRDKNNAIITKSFIDRFVMKLCIYYYTKK
jgi:hypothetical protein